MRPAEGPLTVPAVVREALTAHARSEAPNEACGFLAIRHRRAARYLPAVNVLGSPFAFELEPRDPADLFVEDEGFELAVFHSHPFSPAEPSRTDIERIGLWAGAPYLILSLSTGDLRGFRILAGAARPLPLA